MSEKLRSQWFRFSLRTLLFITALVATFLGYAQWRRQTIMREARALELLGFTLLWQPTWADWIWPVVPKQAAFDYRKTPDNLKIGPDGYREPEFNAFYEQVCDRLRALGVEDVRLDSNGKAGDSYTSTSHGP